MEAKPVLLVNRRDAAQMLSISERTLFSLTKEGVIPALKLGDRGIRYSVRAIENRLAELQAKAEEDAASA